MSIVQTQCTSFKVELYEGIHNFLTDTFKIALYTANAQLDNTTTIYTTIGEVVGTGYVAGGQALTGVTINASDTTAYVSFNNAVWTNCNLTARAALIYNAAKGNRAVAILDFGSDKTATGTLTLVMPANTATTALIRS